MTTLRHRKRKRGEILGPDESSESSVDRDNTDTEALEPDEMKAGCSTNRLCSEDRRSSSSGTLHGQIMNPYERECTERATATSAFMETIQVHLKNTEDNQKKTISLLEKLVDKA
jgi:hypothetical protein